MIESTTGLILRTRPLTETSLIVHWLTPGLGRLSTVARGARRAKSPYLGKLDLFYEAAFTFTRSRRSDLHTLREISLRQTHAQLREQLPRLQQAAYAANLIELGTETETPLPAVYQLMHGLLEHLAKHPPQAQTIFSFELKLLDELGLQPDLQAGHLKPGTKQVALMLGQGDWADLSRLKPSVAQARELDRFLQGFLIFHLGRIPKGRVGAVGIGSGSVNE